LKRVFSLWTQLPGAFFAAHEPRRTDMTGTVNRSVAHGNRNTGWITAVVPHWTWVAGGGGREDSVGVRCTGLRGGVVT